MLNENKIEYTSYGEKPCSLYTFKKEANHIRGYFFDKRTITQAADLEYINYKAIYFLMSEMDDKVEIYIDTCENSVEEIVLHEYKEFWTKSYVFVSETGTLDDVSLNYIKNYFLKLLEKTEYILTKEEIKKYIPDEMDDIKKQQCETDAETIRFLFDFEVKGISDNSKGEEVENNIKYYAAIGKVDARIYRLGDKFVLCRGSQLNYPEKPKENDDTAKSLIDDIAYKKGCKRIDDLIKQKKAFEISGEVRLSVDLIFASSSRAASLASGKKPNGLIFWKNLLHDVKKEEIYGKDEFDDVDEFI
jgi:hypothetical protein